MKGRNGDELNRSEIEVNDSRMKHPCELDSRNSRSIDCEYRFDAMSKQCDKQ